MAKSLLAEAFEQLDLVDSGEFDFSKKGAEELAKFQDDDAFEDFETVIDPNAHSEEELQDSYIGMVILGCDVCNSMIYKAPEEVVIDEESQMANVGECCPYCFETDGFKIIGKVAPFEEVSVDVAGGDGEPTVKVDGKDVSVEDAPEKAEEAIESEQKYPVQSPIAESLESDKDDEELEEALPALATAAITAAAQGAGSRLVDKIFGEDLEQDSDEETDSDELEEAKVTEGLSNREKLLRAFPELNFDRPMRESVENKLEEGIFKSGLVLRGSCSLNPATGLDVDLLQKAANKLKRVQVTGVSSKSITFEKIIKDNIDSYKQVKNLDRLATHFEMAMASLFKEYNKAARDLIQKKKPVKTLDSMVCTVYISVDASLFKRKKAQSLQNKLLFTLELANNSSLRSNSDGSSVNISSDNFRIKNSNTEDVAKILRSVFESYIKEGMEDISITTDDQVIKVKATPRADKEEIEPITPAELDKAQEEAAPVDATTSEDGEELAVEGEDMEVELDEIDSESFDELGESYLKKVYDNVNSFKTTNATLLENKLTLEGIIEFASGKKAKTKFLFEGKEITKRGKVRFTGLNENLSKNKKAFTLIGTIKNKNLVCEAFNYNYLAKDGKTAKRLYGTIKK